MRLIEFSGPGGPEVLKIATAPQPVPGEGEVLIKVHAAGVNRPDIAQRAGQYPPPPGASPILGLEVAGKIAACGPGVVRWRVGDPVCALTPGGGYAEFCVAPEGQCLPIPQGLSYVEAAALPETFFTVWSNVFERGRLLEGETFLVHGGSSGIGVTAIQLARAFGARVLCTVGSERKAEVCRSLGAEAAINYRKQDFVAEVKRATEGRGADVVLDMVGGDYFSRNLDCLASDGRLVQIAFLHGSEVTLPLGKLMAKRLTLTGSTLRPQTVERKSQIARRLLVNVWPLLEEGKIRVVLDRTFAFDEVQDAHRRMESSEHIGKIVLTLSK
jgi:putative PIG3 family NAD(P)H quinone oxidoreductase